MNRKTFAILSLVGLSTCSLALSVVPDVPVAALPTLPVPEQDLELAFNEEAGLESEFMNEAGLDGSDGIDIVPEPVVVAANARLLEEITDVLLAPAVDLGTADIESEWNAGEETEFGHDDEDESDNIEVVSSEPAAVVQARLLEEVMAAYGGVAPVVEDTAAVAVINDTGIAAPVNATIPEDAMIAADNTTATTNTTTTPIPTANDTTLVADNTTTTATATDAPMTLPTIARLLQEVANIIAPVPVPATNTSAVTVDNDDANDQEADLESEWNNGEETEFGTAEDDIDIVPEPLSVVQAAARLLEEVMPVNATSVVENQGEADLESEWYSEENEFGEGELDAEDLVDMIN